MKRLIVTLTTGILVACGGGGSETPAQPAQPKPLQVFVFAGQSDILGADATITDDEVHDLAEAGLQTAADKSTRLALGGAESYPWGDVRGHNGVARGERYVGAARVKVHGPEVGFSRALGGNIAIVKYATNFAGLDNGRSPWVKPGWAWTDWQAFVDAQLAQLNQPYVIAGVIWWQGVDDGVLYRPKAAYKADLVQIAADVRAKFGNVPFIVGVDTVTPDVHDAQMEVGVMNGNGRVEIDDLLPYIYGYHLSEPAQVTMGRRFAAEYKRLRP